MRRGTNSSKFNYLFVVIIKNTIEYLCLFIKIECAVTSCAFDFFYILKEKHCRSPPLINSKKLNWLEEREMQENAKCFIRVKKGIYDEITYKELEEKRRKYTTYRRKKFIPVQGMLIEVLPTEYRSFYKEVERNKYVSKRERELEIFSYNALNDEDNKNIDIIKDLNTDIEFQIERKIEVEQVKQALLELKEDEYKLIKALFYEEKSLREYAKILGIPFATVQTRKRAILKKLKKFLKF